MEQLIVAEAVWHTYPNGIDALRGVDLFINKQDYIALIGANGSGKTTLVKHFNGLLRPTRGRVQVKGLDTRHVPSERLATIVGYTFQNPDHMLFSISIEEEVSFGPRNLKLPADEIKHLVDEALEVTGLSAFRKESPLFFGKGVRRMITIASILSMRPEVLVIDEPTTGMDHRGRLAVMGLLDELSRRGHTIIIITHDMQIVTNRTRRTVVMHEGVIALDVPTTRLFEHENILARASLKPPQRIQLAQALKLTNAELPSVEALSRYVEQCVSASSDRDKEAEEHAKSR